jgi:hypothetical protein
LVSAAHRARATAGDRCRAHFARSLRSSRHAYGDRSWRREARDSSCRSVLVRTSSIGACRPNTSPNSIGGTVTCREVLAPGEHARASCVGRTVWDKDATLWTGYAMLGTGHRVYYSGDTGYSLLLATSARAMVRSIARSSRPDSTIARGLTGTLVRSKRCKRTRWCVGGVMIPVHWGLFQLAFHGWTEPVERVLAAAALRGVAVATPRPGESVEPTDALGDDALVAITCHGRRRRSIRYVVVADALSGPLCENGSGSVLSMTKTRRSHPSDSLTTRRLAPIRTPTDHCNAARRRVRRCQQRARR